MENVDKALPINSGVSHPQSLTRPGVSIIVPLYNAEKYVSESLESVLNQTFQNFEIIVVDDCSTDKSFEIVESYIPKFNGRLILTKMRKNTGGCALPRNKGMLLSRGEYIKFLDADDKLTKTALEEMYTLAKEYDADVIYCEKYYLADADGTNVRITSSQKRGTLVKVPTWESENILDRIEDVLQNRIWVTAWDKFVRRDLILDNELFFPYIRPSEDDVWLFGLLFYGKKFLRVPNAIYIWRMSEGSVMRTERTPQQNINFWMNPALLGTKSLNKIIHQHEFFQTNPSSFYAVLGDFINKKFNLTLHSARELTEDEIYSAIQAEFSEKLGEYDVLISALCTALYEEKKSLYELTSHLTARIDVLLVPKTDDGDFRILSVSDSKVNAYKPEWFQKKGIGYVINSYVGKLEVIAKSTVDGQIQLQLKGRNVRDPEDDSKRIPYWIDYTKFSVNKQTIFDTVIPAWHDKPYRYNMEVKADEEITIEVEWLPHGNNTAPTESKNLTKKTTELEKYNIAYSQIIGKFANYINARIDILLVAETESNSFQILSVSDSNAKVTKPAWFQKNGIGYVINSMVGELKFVAKTTVDGQIQLSLRGSDVREPDDKSKRIPYWIDYTKLSINKQTIFDRLIPAWHDKPYRLNMEVKANKKFLIEVEWLPHRSDT